MNTSKLEFFNKAISVFFKGVDTYHASIQKALLYQVLAFAIITSAGFYFSASLFVLTPYIVISLFFILISSIPYMAASSASEIKDNLEEIKEAFESSKEAVTIAQDAKSEKDISEKSIVKMIGFFNQLTSLPGLSVDTVSNLTSAIKLLTPPFVFMLLVANMVKYVQIAALITSALIIIF